MKKAFQHMLHGLGQVNPIHATTMVPVEVKTMKIQAGVQVPRPEELRRHLQHWKRFGRLYFCCIWCSRHGYIPRTGLSWRNRSINYTQRLPIIGTDKAKTTRKWLNRANTNTRTEEHTKIREEAIKVKLWSKLQSTWST
ncbi:hypothetical protein Tco_0913920 [Tanacetum coccineum]